MKMKTEAREKRHTSLEAELRKTLRNELKRTAMEKIRRILEDCRAHLSCQINEMEVKRYDELRKTMEAAAASIVTEMASRVQIQNDKKGVVVTVTWKMPTTKTEGERTCR